MRVPLTEVEKESIYNRKMSGETLAEIARDLGCSQETVRKWWRHKRDGKESKSRGRRKTGIGSTYSKEIREMALELKQKYPCRGPSRIRLDLALKLGTDVDELPAPSTLAVLFRQECPKAVTVYNQRSYKSKPPIRPSKVHQVWQIDGKECVPYGDGEVATVLNIRDPYIGTIIDSKAFHTTTELHCRKLTRTEIQDVLRTSFQRWGTPEIIQTDNENVYVGAAEQYFPSPFTLWLVGLGINHSPSRKGKPTDQGSVERGHRTQQNWCWADESFDTLNGLQQSLTDNQQFYNHSYPCHAGQCNGQPPLVAFPAATHSGRAFEPALEWELFKLERVDQFLASKSWKRLADSRGIVRIAKQKYSLSPTYKGNDIFVTFSVSSRTFCFYLDDGSLIAEKPALGLDKAELIGRTTNDSEWPVQLEPFQLSLPF